MYDKNGRLTREGAIQAIKNGGSVIFGSAVYSKVENLPPESFFVGNDKDAIDAARTRLENMRREIDGDLARLDQRAVAPPPPAASTVASGISTVGLPDSDNLDEKSITQLKVIALNERVALPNGAHKEQVAELIRDARNARAAANRPGPNNP